MVAIVPRAILILIQILTMCLMQTLIKKHVIVYFLIPNTLADNIEVMVDDDNMLINNDETSELFKSWYHYSDCRGSRVCGLHDSYVPKNIEYVKIGLVSCN
jgi:hypothetical protein